MSRQPRPIYVVAMIVALLGAIYAAKRHRLNKEYDREHPLSALAAKLNASGNREWCDDQIAPRRKLVAAVVDRYRSEIQNLWKNREQKKGEEVPTIPLGRISLRITEAEKPSEGLQGLEFSDSSWSWGEAYGLVLRTQQDVMNENQQRLTWRDIDTMALYLLEKDFARLQLGRKFEAPEITEHQFRPNGAVSRTGQRELTVKLDAGEFRGYEKALQEVLDKEWSGKNGALRVKIQWVKDDPAAYRFEANLTSGRTYVNHRRRAIVLENLAWTRTVAHEFGHVLGFDDHYYSVWHKEHCYYTQLARNGDLMSNSQHGHITARHWELLDRAYPAGKPPAPAFGYVFSQGKANQPASIPTPAKARQSR